MTDRSTRKKTRQTAHHHLDGFPATVRIVRERHPLEGHELAVMGWMRRRGSLDLLVVLPDGSRSLIAAAWTNLEGVAAPLAAAGTLALLENLLAARRVLDGLLERVVLAGQEDCPREHSDRAVTSGSGGELGTGGGAVGAAGRAAAPDGDGAAERVDRAGGRWGDGR